MTHNGGMRRQGKHLSGSSGSIRLGWLRLCEYVQKHKLRSLAVTTISVFAGIATIVQVTTGLFTGFFDASAPQASPASSASPKQNPSLKATFGARHNRDLYEFLDSHVGQYVHLSVSVKSAADSELQTSVTPESWHVLPDSIRAPRRLAASMEMGTAGTTEENALVVLDIDTTPTGAPRCYYPSEENPFDWTIEGTFFVEKSYTQIQQLIIALRPASASQSL